MPGTSPWIRRMALALVLAGVVGLALIALRLREQHRRALTDAWLFCIECDHGELSAVVRMRDAAVRHLAGSLLRGRGTRRHASMEARIRATYSPDPALSEDAYVDLMMADYLAGYQERAITGLRVLADSGIGSAAEALRAALDSVDTGGLVLRSDVLDALEQAVIRLDTSGPPAWSESAEYGDTVTVRRQAAPGWDTASLGVVLPGSPFPGDLLVTRSPDSARFLAVAPVGTRFFAVGDSSRQELGRLAITHLRYRMHTTATAESLASNREHIRFPVLIPWHDVFRLTRVGADSRAHLAVAWAAPAEVRVLLRCGIEVAQIPPPIANVRGTVLGPTGVMAGAVVRDTAGNRQVTADADGRFQIDSIPTASPVELVAGASGHESLSFLVQSGQPVYYGVRLAAKRGRNRVREVFVLDLPIEQAPSGAGCRFVDIELLPDPPLSAPLITRLRVVPGTRPRSDLGVP